MENAKCIPWLSPGKGGFVSSKQASGRISISSSNTWVGGIKTGPLFICLGLEKVSFGSLSWAFDFWAKEIFSFLPSANRQSTSTDWSAGPTSFKLLFLSRGVSGHYVALPIGVIIVTRGASWFACMACLVCPSNAWSTSPAVLSAWIVTL